ncbi:MAG: hypothetical protein HY436_00990 [Candidatus Liptonbacteria bacterium]|nr:hypothetical protein [Candidatus Liptonbacteria bacterium]
MSRVEAAGLLAFFLYLLLAAEPCRFRGYIFHDTDPKGCRYCRVHTPARQGLLFCIVLLWASHCIIRHAERTYPSLSLCYVLVIQVQARERRKMPGTPRRAIPLARAALDKRDCAPVR